FGRRDEDTVNAPVSLSELVTHAAWLRRLAAGLLRDQDAAEDVVHATFVAAWRNPPEADRDVRPWLAEVARNQAHDQRRGEGRRQAREAAAHQAAVLSAEARGAAVSPETLIGDLEIHRQVAEVVAGLDEPYRSTVVLHYYDGLDTPEVARRLGVASGTIRWRLKEGLERIRVGLDRKHAGVREKWQQALLPLVPAGALASGEAAAVSAAAARTSPAVAGRGAASSPRGARLTPRAILVAAGGIAAFGFGLALFSLRSSRETVDGAREAGSSSSAVDLEVVAGVRRAPKLAAPPPAVVASGGEPAAASHAFDEQVLDQMLKAVLEDAYESFIQHGGDVFNAQISREIVTDLNKKFGKRLAGGYEAQALGSLRRTIDKEDGEALAGPYATHLWKVAFRDGGDDALVHLSLRNRHVIGFFLQ
ncbi:MAG TPA: RNA polymerase sigma factor, partial [Polyangia bacterium]